jgi:DNA end-binding protein Ku
MRAVWTGSISFGLVNIRVKLVPALKEKKLRFHYLHKKDKSPILYKKVCAKEGSEVPADEIVKGYEYERDRYVLLSEEDFKQADLALTKSIDVFGFIKLSEVDPIYFERPYFLEPADEANKPYILFRDTLKQTGKIALAKIVIKNKEHLAIVRPAEKILILNLLRFKDELRGTDEVTAPVEVEVLPEEIELASSLIEKLTKKFEPEKYEDIYTKRLKAIIEKKIHGEKIVPVGVEPTPTRAPDLLKVLKESLREVETHETAKGA